MSSPSHTLPLSLHRRGGTGPENGIRASAGLLWVDRPFAVTAAHVIRGFQARLEEYPESRLWLGCLEIHNLNDRLLSVSDRHDVATLEVSPTELDCLGEDVAFYSPQSWPPPQVTVGEEIRVRGYPRDQWPSQIEFRFRVESATCRRFGAVLLKAGMPGRLAGLSGSPAFRLEGPNPEFVGVVVDSLFHNEVVRAQHAYHLDACGMLSAAADLA